MSALYYPPKRATGRVRVSVGVWVSVRVTVEFRVTVKVWAVIRKRPQTSVRVELGLGKWLGIGLG